ncbi:stage II sporulation protein M [Candidatus Woesearchaeota archaeon]|nr:stage II sporulation protein M [Candidatus Woesearchaeota archaeon]
MVLESFISPLKAENKPWIMLLMGFIYAFVAVFLSLWIFKQYSSLVMVFLTVIAAVPLVYSTLKLEEGKDTEIKSEMSLLKEHSKALKFFMFMFIGFVLAFVLLYIILPPNLVQLLFSSQTETIDNINSRVSGNAISTSNIFAQIFLNNIKVLMFSIFFAFFYGAGAIFILAWNASVISAAIGNFIRDKIAEYTASIGSLNLFNYFYLFNLGLLRYFIHGIPEILAYFIGALAGGIISVAMINHDIESERFNNIMLDALDLTMLAIFILFIAAIIEVFITPIFF